MGITMMQKLQGQPSFSITVAPPSGRRPRPILRHGAETHLCLTDPLRVTYHYPVSYIRPGRKTASRVWVRDYEFIQVRTVRHSETTPAYRIVSPDAGRQLVEIVEFDNRLWWPIGSHNLAASFFAALAAGESSAVSLLNTSLIRTGKRVTTIDAVNACRLVDDGRIKAAIDIQRAADGLLIIDDQVFVADGEPVYVLWDNRISPKLTPRSCYDFIETLYGTDIDFGYDDLTTALTFGTVFAPTELERLSSLLLTIDADIERHATIEVSGIRKFASDPLEVQTDAAFRKLLRLAAVPRRLPRAAAVEKRQKVTELQQAASASSTLVRARAMQAHLDWLELFPWLSSFHVEHRFLKHVIGNISEEGNRRGVFTPFTQFEPLTEEEDAIVGALAI